jgi:hypothetical protein
MKAKINYSLVAYRRKPDKDPRKTGRRDPRLARRVTIAAFILFLLLLILIPVSCDQPEPRQSVNRPPKPDRTLAQAAVDEARDLKALFQLVGVVGATSSGPPPHPPPRIFHEKTGESKSPEKTKHPARIRKENDGEIWIAVPP